MQDTKVSRLEEGPQRGTVLHSLASAVSSVTSYVNTEVSKEAFDASDVTLEE